MTHDNRNVVGIHCAVVGTCVLLPLLFLNDQQMTIDMAMTDDDGDALC